MNLAEQKVCDDAYWWERQTTESRPKFERPSVEAEGLRMAILRDQVREHPHRKVVMAKHKEFMDSVNPVGMGREKRQDQLANVRAQQKASARAFLVEGEAIQDWQPSYGKKWDREYNPLPYPEALPKDTEMFEGTAIGFLCGLFGESGCAGYEHAWQLAGWNLTRKGAEVRSRRRPK